MTDKAETSQASHNAASVAREPPSLSPSSRPSFIGNSAHDVCLMPLPFEDGKPGNELATPKPLRVQSDSLQPSSLITLPARNETRQAVSACPSAQSFDDGVDEDKESSESKASPSQNPDHANMNIKKNCSRFGTHVSVAKTGSHQDVRSSEARSPHAQTEVFHGTKRMLHPVEELNHGADSSQTTKESFLKATDSYVSTQNSGQGRNLSTINPAPRWNGASPSLSNVMEKRTGEAESPTLKSDSECFFFLCRKLSKTGDVTVIEGWMTEDELLNLRVDNSIEQYAIFLPRITDILEPEKTGSKLSKGFRKKLAKRFNIDKFFLSETGYKSNGFFIDHHMSKRAYGCRFLVKELEPILEFQDFERTRDSVRKKLLMNLSDESVEEMKLRMRESPENHANITSVSDESVQALLQNFARKWTEIQAEGLLDLAKDAPPPKLHDAWVTWLDHTMIVPWEDIKRRQKLYEEIYEILLRSHHALGCIGEKQEEEEAEEEEEEQSGLTSPTPSKTSENGIREPSESSLVIADETMLISQVQSSHSSAQPIPQNGQVSQELQHKEDVISAQPGPSDESQGRKEKKKHNFKMLGWNPSNSIAPIHSKTTENNEPKNQPPKKEGLSTYHWLFLSFWTTFSSVTQHGNGRKNDTNDQRPWGNTEILLCFDDANGKRMRDTVRTALEEGFQSDTPATQANLLPHVVKEIVHTYDNALWGFRDPVRSIEKRLLEKGAPQEQNMKEKLEAKDLLKMYRNMHELSRHLIHSQETLNAAETTFGAILGSKQWENTIATEVFQFCHTFVINLKLRAKAFVDRLDNEIALELHINNLSQLEKMDKLLQENQRDGKEVTKFVGYASILFLPGTFVSGFFSMTFFAFEGSSWPHARSTWIWFAVAFPITAIGLVWLWWSRTKTARQGPIWKVINEIMGNPGSSSEEPPEQQLGQKSGRARASSRMRNRVLTR